MFLEFDFLRKCEKSVANSWAWDRLWNRETHDKVHTCIKIHIIHNSGQQPLTRKFEEIVRWKAWSWQGLMIPIDIIIDNCSKMAPSKIWHFALLHLATLGNHQNIFENKLSLVLFRGMGMSSALFRSCQETQLIWKGKSPAFDSGKVGWYRYCYRPC